MVNVRPIRTEADYEAALTRVAELMDARERDARRGRARCACRPCRGLRRQALPPGLPRPHRRDRVLHGPAGIEPA